MRITNITVDAHPFAGDTLNDCFAEAKRFILDHIEGLDTTVRFNFNGIDCEVTPKSNLGKFLYQYEQLLGAKVTGL